MLTDAEKPEKQQEEAVNVKITQVEPQLLEGKRVTCDQEDQFWYFENDCYSYALFAALKHPLENQVECENQPAQWQRKPSSLFPVCLCFIVVFLQLTLMTLYAHAKGHAFENQSPLPGTENLTERIILKYGYAHDLISSSSLYSTKVFDFISDGHNITLFTFMHFCSFAVAFLYSAGDIYSGLHKAAFCVQMWHLSDNLNFWLQSRDKSLNVEEFTEIETESKSSAQQQRDRGHTPQTRNWYFIIVATILIPFQTFIALHITQWTLKSLYYEENYANVVVDLLVLLYICELDEKVMEFSWIFPRGSSERMDISGTKVRIAYKPDDVISEHNTRRTCIQIIGSWFQGDWLTIAMCVFETLYLPAIVYMFNFAVGSGYIRYVLPKEDKGLEDMSLIEPPGYTWLVIWVVLFLAISWIFLSVRAYRSTEGYSSRDSFSLSKSRQLGLPFLLLFAIGSKLAFRLALIVDTRNATYTEAEIFVAVLCFPLFVYSVKEARNFEDRRRDVLLACITACFIFFERTLFAEYFYRLYELTTGEDAPRPTSLRSF